MISEKVWKNFEVQLANASVGFRAENEDYMVEVISYGDDVFGGQKAFKLYRGYRPIQETVFVDLAVNFLRYGVAF